MVSLLTILKRPEYVFDGGFGLIIVLSSKARLMAFEATLAKAYFSSKGLSLVLFVILLFCGLRPQWAFF